MVGKLILLLGGHRGNRRGVKGANVVQRKLQDKPPGDQGENNGGNDKNSLLFLAHQLLLWSFQGSRAWQKQRRTEGNVQENPILLGVFTVSL